MNNYKPLDISSYYNATISDVEALSDLPHISMLKNIRETLLSDNPQILNTLKWAGIFYLLYLAYDTLNSKINLKKLS